MEDQNDEENLEIRVDGKRQANEHAWGKNQKHDEWNEIANIPMQIDTKLEDSNTDNLCHGRVQGAVSLVLDVEFAVAGSGFRFIGIAFWSVCV